MLRFSCKYPGRKIKERKVRCVFRKRPEIVDGTFRLQEPAVRMRQGAEVQETSLLEDFLRLNLFPCLPPFVVRPPWRESIPIRPCLTKPLPLWIHIQNPLTRNSIVCES